MKYSVGHPNSKLSLKNESPNSEYKIVILQHDRGNGHECPIVGICVCGTAFIFKYIGAVFDIDNQEPFAYLVQWVVWKIWQTKTARIE